MEDNRFALPLGEVLAIVHALTLLIENEPEYMRINDAKSALERFGVIRLEEFEQ